MSDTWIKVGSSDYFIKSDRLCWTVARQVTCKKSKSFPDGRKLINESYHSTLVGAFKHIFEEIVKLAKAEAVQDLIRICEKTYEMLREVLEHDFVESM